MTLRSRPLASLASFRNLGALCVAFFCVAPSLSGCSSATRVETTESGDGGVSEDSAAPSPDSGTDNPDGGSATTEVPQAEAYCNAFKNHNACAGNVAEPCDATSKCLFAKMLPESFEVFVQCFQSPSCKTSDRCLLEAGQASGDPKTSTYVADCTAKASNCPGAFSKDLCSPALFAFPGSGAAARACLTKSCGDIKGCFKALEESLESCSP